MTSSERGDKNRLGRSFVILAPPHVPEPSFLHLSEDPDRHEQLLAEAQRLRGTIYLQDGAIQASELTSDGRHIQHADDLSWHLLTVDPMGSVTACIRYQAHQPHHVAYSDLGISTALTHQPSSFNTHVKRAVQSEIENARQLGFQYVELGGWVVGPELRCSTEAIRMLLMMYALSRSLGGALALSTATTRHNSSAILRRTGGESMSAAGVDVPRYFDPHYDCEMEVLRFDSRFPNPRYSGWIREFVDALRYLPIISSTGVATTTGLLQLHSAVAEEPSYYPVSQ